MLLKVPGIKEAIVDYYEDPMKSRMYSLQARFRKVLSGTLSTQLIKANTVMTMLDKYHVMAPKQEEDDDGGIDIDIDIDIIETILARGKKK